VKTLNKLKIITDNRKTSDELSVCRIHVTHSKILNYVTERASEIPDYVVETQKQPLQVG